MIEATQTVPVRAGMGEAWKHVRNIGNWAELMPGLRGYEIINEDDSNWVLKVGVGALVRTVKVNVHVDQWDGPERASFSFNLQGDPVIGRGAYLAKATEPNETDMTLTLEVEGTGPMAPMWEAMGAPLLPKFALSFARQLAGSIEQASGALAPPSNVAASLSDRVLNWLLRLWRSLWAARTS